MTGTAPRRSPDRDTARVGHRRILPTVAQTVGIATAAAVAGLAVGKLIS